MVLRVYKSRCSSRKALSRPVDRSVSRIISSKTNYTNGNTCKCEHCFRNLELVRLGADAGNELVLIALSDGETRACGYLEERACNDLCDDLDVKDPVAIRAVLYSCSDMVSSERSRVVQHIL